MRILYISPGNGMDYLCDTVLIGLKYLFGSDVIDINKVKHIYKTFPEKELKNQYGQGFTICRTVEDQSIDNVDVDLKLINNYYDFIFYGSVWRSLDKIDLVLKYYPKNRIIALDGEEPPNPEIHPIADKVTYFKRELYNNYPEVLPIQFSFPDSKFALYNTTKTKDIAFITPLNKETYIHTTEKKYYEDYASSYFAITTKKGGWDCMRHYEILGNGCIPYFINLQECPKNTLHNFPKELLQSIYKTVDFTESLKLNESKNFYSDKINELLEYTKNNLISSQYVKKHIIEKIS
jgi:hypothetical protein